MIAPGLLALIPGCEDGRPPLAVAALPGGQGRNSVLRVDTRAGSFVLRRRLPPVDRPGAAAMTELGAHRAAAAAGLAPAVLRAADDGAWMLMEFIDAPCWSDARLCSPAGVMRLGARLARLHGVPLPQGVPEADPDAMAAGYLQRIAARDPRAASTLRPLALQVEALGRELAESGERRVLVHGDLMASNLLGEAPLLVDWEYAQAADPTWDLACLLAYYPALEPWLAQLLDAAGCRADARLLGLQRVRFALLNRLWKAAYPA